MGAAEDVSQWHTLAPCLYDYFVSHHLAWPSLTCRWSPTPSSQSSLDPLRRVLLSERTGSAARDRIIAVDLPVPPPRSCSASTWALRPPPPGLALPDPPALSLSHPGEVTKLRELPSHPHLAATHSDSPHLYLWDVYGRSCGEASQPLAVLGGHADKAEYALACSQIHPLVASGGRDAAVLLWDVESAAGRAGVGGEASPAPRTMPPSGNQASSTPKPPLPHPSSPTQRLAAHTATVEGLAFCPRTRSLLASVGDDARLCVWDLRSGTRPVQALEWAHGRGEDVHCVDWNAMDPCLLASGAADGSLRVWDARRLGSAEKGEALAVWRRSGAEAAAAALCAEWSPLVPGVLATGMADGRVAVWRMGEADEGEAGAKPLFVHDAHCGEVPDLHWHPAEPWTLLSVAEAETGGGQVQIWRVLDLVVGGGKRGELALQDAWGECMAGADPASLDPMRRRILGARDADACFGSVL